MSAREWQPGDVAMVDSPGTSIHGKRAIRTVASDDRPAAWVVAESSWLSMAVGDRELRPLVVIDPEDREQMRGIAECAADGDAAEWRVDMWQRYFRGLANPTPPKPDEPTDLAVRVMAEGSIWAKVGSWWTCANLAAVPRDWDSLIEADDFRVLSEGVPS